MKKILTAGPSITNVEKEYVNEMMNSGWDNYKYVEKFESEFSKWHKRNFGLMTPNCTQAIHLILLSIGIRENDEVILPELTWTATAAPITYLRAKPVFADVNEKNWCLCPNSVEKKITNKTKAIIFVDLYGNMPCIEELKKISLKYNLPLIEDSAEALGSVYKDTRAGKFGIAGVHSFHRTKTITTGEGGFLLIDDEGIYNRAKFLRDHGRSNKIPYYTLEATPKYMPSNLQGALALAQFQRIDELITKKRYIYKFYKNYFNDINDITINIDDEKLYNGVWATSIVFGDSYNFNKIELIDKLKKDNIPLRPFFYPLSSLPAYESYKSGNSNLNPISYKISNKGITLPCHYNLDDEQLEFISKGIINYIKKN